MIKKCRKCNAIYNPIIWSSCDEDGKEVETYIDICEMCCVGEDRERLVIAAIFHFQSIYHDMLKLKKSYEETFIKFDHIINELKSEIESIKNDKSR